MKTFITLESASIYTENNPEMPVVSREIGRYKEVLWVLRVLIVEYRESFFSQLEQWIVKLL